MDGLEIDLEDFSEGFVAEMIKYHNEEIKSLRNDYMTLQDISRTSQHVDEYEEIFQTIEDKANWHKSKIREIIRGQFNLS
jgi:hypothetical protein